MLPFLCLVPGEARSQSTDIFRFVQIDDRIWASVTREGINTAAYANSVVIAGDSAVMVVDTRHSLAAGRRLVREIQRATRLPVRYVVNTHHHGHHVWGNGAMAREWPAARFLAHPAAAEEMQYESDLALAQELERLTGLITRLEEALAGGELPPSAVPAYRSALERYRTQRSEVTVTTAYLPDDLVMDDRVIHLGNRTVRVIHPMAAHTTGDLVVWVDDVRLLVAGDLVREGTLSLEGSDVRGWAGALAQLTQLGPARVIPGHGRIRDDAALLEAHSGFLVEAIALASAGMPASGEAMAEVLRRHEVALAPFGVSRQRFLQYVEAVRDAVGAGRRQVRRDAFD